MSDLRHALRVLAKSPLFTSVAILSLALGIGANTATYSVVRAVLLEPLPVRAPDQLVEAGWNTGRSDRRSITTIGSTGFRDERTGKNYGSNFSYSLFKAFQQTAGGTADLFAFSYAASDVNVSFDNQPVVASGLLVSGNYFSTLGVTTSVGRPLNEEDDRPDAPPAAVLSHGFWTRVFGGDPGVLGKSIRVNGSPFAIVGVTAPGFFGMSKGGFFAPTDVMMPLAAQPLVYTRWAPAARSLFSVDDKWWLHVMARVKPGTAASQVEAALNITFRRSLGASGAVPAEQARAAELRLFSAARGVDVLTRRMQQPLLILSGVVAIVLLIACVNLANLMLARGVARQKEMSIRLALGSGRLRLARAVFVESLVLALAGGALGLFIGGWGGRALVATLAAGAGRTALDLSIDWRLLGATAVVSTAAGLLFGVVPALRVARGDLAPTLKQVALGAHATRLNAGRVLMAAQVAITVPLLVGALLFVRTVYNLGRVELGFNPERLLLFRLDPSLNGYNDDRIERLYGQVLQRLATIPGVTSTTLVDVVLLSRLQNSWTFLVEGSEPKNVKFARVGPGFFDTIGIPIVAGRAIGVQDRDRAPRVAVVNEAAARELFGPGSPIGRRLAMRVEPPVEYEVVGVARDSRYTSPRDPMPSTVYLPYAQATLGRTVGPMNVVVRAAVPPASLAGPIRAAVADVDRDVPVTDMKTESDQIDETLGTERMFMRLLVVFGTFALLLACIGLHGVTAYSVARRTSEIGVRIALGAQRTDVLWLILRQVVVIAAVGLAAGIPASIAATRLVRATLYGVEPSDPISLAVAAVVMAIVAGAAGLLPASRAAGLDPLTALRHE